MNILNIEKKSLETSPTKSFWRELHFLTSKKTIIVIISVVVLLIALITSFYFYNKYQQLRNNPSIAAQNEVKSLVDKVGTIIDLPTDEMPTVVTVEDKSKLTGESFFTNAENGDILMTFSKAMKAILYRPSENKIIEVGLFNSQPVATTTTSIATSSKATVTIRNGTTITGLANLVAKKIILDEDINVAFVGNAIKHTYLKTIVIDITGENTKIVDDLAKILGAIVTKLPVGESKSTSDILIIAGKDMKQ